MTSACDISRQHHTTMPTVAINLAARHHQQSQQKKRKTTQTALNLRVLFFLLTPALLYLAAPRWMVQQQQSGTINNSNAYGHGRQSSPLATAGTINASQVTATVPTLTFFGLNTGIAAIGGGGKLFMSPLYALSLAAAAATTAAPSAAAPPSPAAIVVASDGDVDIGLGLIGNDPRERSAPTADPFAAPRYSADDEDAFFAANNNKDAAIPIYRPTTTTVVAAPAIHDDRNETTATTEGGNKTTEDTSTTTPTEEEATTFTSHNDDDPTSTSMRPTRPTNGPRPTRDPRLITRAERLRSLSWAIVGGSVGLWTSAGLVLQWIIKPNYSILHEWIIYGLAVLTIVGVPALFTYLHGRAAEVIGMKNPYFRVGFGESTKLLMAMTILPACRHLTIVKLAFRSSFERVMSLHIIIGVLALLAGTAHGAGLMYVRPERAISLRGRYPGLYGTLSWGVMLLMILTGFLRRWFYITFRLAHWGYVAAFAFAIIHDKLFWNMLGAPLALLALDYIWRIGSAFWFGARVADAEFDENAKTTWLRLSVKPYAAAAVTHAGNAGDYYCIAIPGAGLLFPHPFSVVSTDPKRGEMLFAIQVEGPWTRALGKIAAKTFFASTSSNNKNNNNKKQNNNTTICDLYDDGIVGRHGTVDATADFSTNRNSGLHSALLGAGGNNGSTYGCAPSDTNTDNNNSDASSRLALATTAPRSGTSAAALKQQQAAEVARLIKKNSLIGRRVVLMGPYGALSFPLDKTGTLLIVVGGSGVAPALSLLEDLVVEDDSSDPISPSTSRGLRSLLPSTLFGASSSSSANNNNNDLVVDAFAVSTAAQSPPRLRLRHPSLRAVHVLWASRHSSLMARGAVLLDTYLSRCVAAGLAAGTAVSAELYCTEPDVVLPPTAPPADSMFVYHYGAAAAAVGSDPFAASSSCAGRSTPATSAAAEAANNNDGTKKQSNSAFATLRQKAAERLHVNDCTAALIAPPSARGPAALRQNDAAADRLVGWGRYGGINSASDNNNAASASASLSASASCGPCGSPTATVPISVASASASAASFDKKAMKSSATAATSTSTSNGILTWHAGRPDVTDFFMRHGCGNAAATAAHSASSPSTITASSSSTASDSHRGATATAAIAIDVTAAAAKSLPNSDAANNAPLSPPSESSFASAYLPLLTNNATAPSTADANTAEATAPLLEVVVANSSGTPAIMADDGSKQQQQHLMAAATNAAVVNVSAPYVPYVNVFSCGPDALLDQAKKSVSKANKALRAAHGDATADDDKDDDENDAAAADAKKKDKDQKNAATTIRAHYEIYII